MQSQNTVSAHLKSKQILPIRLCTAVWDTHVCFFVNADLTIYQYLRRVNNSIGKLERRFDY